MTPCISPTPPLCLFFQVVAEQAPVTAAPHVPGIDEGHEDDEDEAAPYTAPEHSAPHAGMDSPRLAAPADSTPLAGVDSPRHTAPLSGALHPGVDSPRLAAPAGSPPRAGAGPGSGSGSVPVPAVEYAPNTPTKFPGFDDDDDDDDDFYRGNMATPIEPSDAVGDEVVPTPARGADETRPLLGGQGSGSGTGAPVMGHDELRSVSDGDLV